MFLEGEGSSNKRNVFSRGSNLTTNIFVVDILFNVVDILALIFNPICTAVRSQTSLIFWTNTLNKISSIHSVVSLPSYLLLSTRRRMALDVVDSCENAEDENLHPEDNMMELVDALRKEQLLLNKYHTHYCLQTLCPSCKSMSFI